VAALGYPRPWVVEAVQRYTGGRSWELERRARSVLYTSVNDFKNQGVNEFRSVREALLTFGLAGGGRGMGDGGLGGGGSEGHADR
jgi:hypothetical protein